MTVENSNLSHLPKYGQMWQIWMIRCDEFEWICGEFGVARSYFFFAACSLLLPLPLACLTLYLLFLYLKPAPIDCTRTAPLAPTICDAPLPHSHPHPLSCGPGRSQGHVVTHFHRRCYVTFTGGVTWLAFTDFYMMYRQVLFPSRSIITICSLYEQSYFTVLVCQVYIFSKGQDRFCESCHLWLRYLPT